MNKAGKNIYLGHFLRDARMQRGLSQQEVAKSLGYESSQFISNWERGISTPPMEAVKTLAALYKVDADAMFELILESTVERVVISLKQRYYGKKSI